MRKEVKTMKKNYCLVYSSYLTNIHCRSAETFKTKKRANEVRKQYIACGHKNVKIVEAY